MVKHLHPLEKEMATHSSAPAWKIPWTEEPGGLQSVGSQRVGHGKAGEAFHSWTQYLIPPSVPHKNFLPPRKSPSVGLLMSLRQLSFPFSLPLFCEKQPSLENSESIHALPKSAALSCSALWIRSLWWLQRWETHVRISEWVQCCLFSMELRLESSSPPLKIYIHTSPQLPMLSRDWACVQSLMETCFYYLSEDFLWLADINGKMVRSAGLTCPTIYCI